MKLKACSIILVTFMLGIPDWVNAEGIRELKVHLAQANNNSPYAFVRVNPGEIADLWAVRFFDDEGKEVPYFVWDSITWRVAREGREEWGKRYALLNRAPGDALEILEARGKKLEWLKKTILSAAPTHLSRTWHDGDLLRHHHRSVTNEE